MKIGLIDTILLSLGLALFFIGVHQTMHVGIKASYWIFMFSSGFIFWFRYRRATQTPSEPPTVAAISKKDKKKKTKS